MAGSDLDPILQESDGNDDDERSSTPEWSWICFHCHSSRTVTPPSVVCICRTLKSVLYRRAFHYSTRLIGGVGGGGGGTCNLEYQRQNQGIDRPTSRRRLSSQTDVPLNEDDGDRGECLRQTPLLPRRFTYYEGNTGSPSPSSSFPSLGSMTSSSDVVVDDAQRGERRLPGTTCVECDNKSCRLNDGHRPISINRLANISCSSHSCAVCSRQKQKPNSITQIPEFRRKQQQQQQQQVCQRSPDNDDCNNKTTTTTSSTYTRCKLRHRSYDDLKTLLENFRMQVQAVSEDLVRLLEERHDMKQQIDMRNIAIEQLLRLQQSNEETTTTRQSQAADDGTEKVETIELRGQIEDRTISGRDEPDIERRTSETKECFFTSTLRTIRTIE